MKPYNVKAICTQQDGNFVCICAWLFKDVNDPELLVCGKRVPKALLVFKFEKREKCYFCIACSRPSRCCACV
jgi:hypothetical protein